MRACILLLWLAACAITIASRTSAAGSSGTAPDKTLFKTAARCVLDVRGGSSGSPAINFTCSGPLVKAYIRRDEEVTPVLLATRGVKVVHQPDCWPDDAPSYCMIALCSSKTPVVIEKGSQLLEVESPSGVLCISGNATVSMEGMAVVNNTGHAPVRVAGNSSAAFNGCQFLDNEYAVYVQRNAGTAPNVSITQCRFAGNYVYKESYGGGAAVYSESGHGKIVISNSTFSNNGVTGVASGGGAIYTGTDITFHNVNFVENYVMGAMAGGGAVWADIQVNLVFKDSTFTGNWVEGDASEGGAVYCRDSSTITVVGGKLEGNSAWGERARGGAISTNISVQVELRGVTVQDNQVVGPFGQGGAIFVNEGGVMRATGMCAMRNNSAEFGGALALHDADITLENTSFTGNTATQYDGGAIYAVATDNTWLLIRASTFFNNRALFDGGAVLARTASKHNAAEAGVDASGSVQLLVQLSQAMLVNNRAMRGSGGAVNVDGGQLVISNNTKFQNNTAAADGGGFAIYAASSIDLLSVALEKPDTLQPGCPVRWEPGMAILNVSQTETTLEGNSADRAGGAGFIGKYVHCNTTAVLSLRGLGTVPNTAPSSSFIQAPGACEAGFYWTSAGMCAKCPHGTFRLLNATRTDDVACQPCPSSPGYICTGGDTVRPLPHYWMPDYTQAEYAANLSAATAPSVYWCPGHQACPGCSFDCSQGYRGRLCSQCDEGFASPAPFKCTRCSTKYTTPVHNLIISTAFTIGMVYVRWTVAWHSKPGCFFAPGDVLKQGVWFCQVLVIVSRSSEAAWAPCGVTFFNLLAVAFAQGELGSVPAVQCLAGGRLTAVLPWGLWRGILSMAFIAAWLIVLVSGHVLVVGVLAMCGVQAVDIQSENQPGKIVRASSFLREAMGLDRNFSAWRSELWDRLHMLVYVALDQFYPVLLRISLSSFMCIELEGQQFWFVDMSVTCWTGRHLPWVIIMGVMGVIFLVVVVPVNLTVLEARMHAAGATAQGPLTGLGRLQQYLFGAYRERCKAWEGLLQIRLVLLVLISVASPSIGPFYTLIAYFVVLAAFAVHHDVQKPYKDLCLQQLQTLAYLVLLVNVGLGMVAMTAETRPGPRTAHRQQGPQGDQAAMQQHCPDQSAGQPDLSKTVLAASVTMVIINTLFIAAACLVMYSLLTRKKRGKDISGQLLQLGTGSAPVWVMGLGFTNSSKACIPVVHAGHWADREHAECSTVVVPQQRCWLFTAWLVFVQWLKEMFTVFCWWPQEDTKQPEQQSQSPVAEQQVQQTEPAALLGPLAVGDMLLERPIPRKLRAAVAAADANSGSSSTNSVGAGMRSDVLLNIKDQG